MAVALATITQRPGARQSGLLVDVWHQPKIGALTDHIEAEGPFAAVVKALRDPMALSVAHTLANAVPLILGHCGQDCEHQLADAVAGDVAAEINHVQADLV